MIGRRPVLAGLAAAPFLMAQRAPGPPPIAQTRAGRFEGRTEQGIHVFKGIRYGRVRRFEGTYGMPPSTETVQAFDYGPSCPQPGRHGLTVSEDCLFLNIWTPEVGTGVPGPGGIRRGRLPVMIYLHGGAYSTGTPVSPMLDGARLAAQGVVVVTLAHRLNVFGYLYLARIDRRFGDSGNNGQIDLLTALAWLQENIGSFGGDPFRITLFGQSGGGAKIATLMGMNLAHTRFHRAATMSGQQVTVSGPQHATERARVYMARVGARTPEDLVSMPVERLVDGLDATDPYLGGNIYMGPVLDMKWLIRHPFWPDANPIGNRVPLMLGNTRDETRAFYRPDHPKLVGLDWDNIAERIAPELRIDAHPEWVVAEYRRTFRAWTPEQVFFAATTAGRSWRAQLIEAEERARAGVPAYVYQLNHPNPAPHGADIPLVFGTYDDPAARPVSEAMMRAFVAFARTGNPGWPPYEPSRRQTMMFDTVPSVVSDPRRQERELFATIPYIQPGT